MSISVQPLKKSDLSLNKLEMCPVCNTVTPHRMELAYALPSKICLAKSFPVYRNQPVLFTYCTVCETIYDFMTLDVSYYEYRPRKVVSNEETAE